MLCIFRTFPRYVISPHCAGFLFFGSHLIVHLATAQEFQTVLPKSFLQTRPCILGLENTQSHHSELFLQRQAATWFCGHLRWCTSSFPIGETELPNTWCPSYQTNFLFHQCFAFAHIVARWSMVVFGKPCLRYMAALLGSLACMETLMNTEGRRMSDSACGAFEKAYLCYRASLNWLARRSLDAKKPRYRMRPKVHQVAHMVYDYLPLNPRKMSNYLDEDFIFKTKKVAEKAHPLFMPTHVAMKYSVAACLRWWKGPFWFERVEGKRSAGKLQFWEQYCSVLEKIVGSGGRP